MGGVIVADLTGDGLLDFVVTGPGTIDAYGHSGAPLWSLGREIRLSGKSEIEGLPGLHAPGVQVGDPDGDGTTDLLYLNHENGLVRLDAATGAHRETVAVSPPPAGAERWEHFVVANLRGTGDRDILFQATNAEGYRMGRYVAAFAFGDWRNPLWSTDRYVGCAHSGLRAVDIDGDGRDEVLGATIIEPNGRVVEWTRPIRFGRGLLEWVFGHRFDGVFNFPNYRGHLDAIHAADVDPAHAGLEVVALQEGGSDRVFLYGKEAPMWAKHFRNEEPQNAAVGDFDPARPGLEIWARSRFKQLKNPFVFSAAGELIADWDLIGALPESWTTEGIEEISPIHWDGSPRQLLAAKERHTHGHVAIIDALTGRFIRRFPTAARRLYVADIAGDWREELIVLTSDELILYANDEPLPAGSAENERLWNSPAYRRSKMTYNYYAT